MTEALGLALVVGVALGGFYFGTLWLVVRRLDRVPWPAMWLGVTAAFRLAVVLVVVTLIAETRWERLVVATVGFVAVRIVLTRWLGRPAAVVRRPGPGRVRAGGT